MGRQKERGEMKLPTASRRLRLGRKLTGTSRETRRCVGIARELFHVAIARTQAAAQNQAGVMPAEPALPFNSTKSTSSTSLSQVAIGPGSRAHIAKDMLAQPWLRQKPSAFAATSRGASPSRRRRIGGMILEAECTSHIRGRQRRAAPHHQCEYAHRLVADHNG